MKKGFTLAEVLITLAIIGIVAALTLPGLIAKYQKQVTANRLKAAYSLFEQAFKLSETENGEIKSWDIPISNDNDKIDEFWDKYLIKYFKISGEYNNYPINNIDGNMIRATDRWKVLPNGISAVIFPNIYTDGTNPYAWIYVDLNGKGKPNRLGIDIFMFEFYRNNKFRMWGSTEGSLNREEILSTGSYACKLNTGKLYAGGYCGLLIMLDNWKIEKDYPW